MRPINFRKCQHPSFFKTLAYIYTKFVLNTPYLLCTELLALNKIFLKKLKRHHQNVQKWSFRILLVHATGYQDKSEINKGRKK